jgi:hypothetical protein
MSAGVSVCPFCNRNGRNSRFLCSAKALRLDSPAQYTCYLAHCGGPPVCLGVEGVDYS